MWGQGGVRGCAAVQVPEYCALGEGDVRSINAWIGPAGTVTPLHTDPHHNLFVQVQLTSPQLPRSHWFACFCVVPYTWSVRRESP